MKTADIRLRIGKLTIDASSSLAVPHSVFANEIASILSQRDAPIRSHTGARERLAASVADGIAKGLGTKGISLGGNAVHQAARHSKGSRHG